MDDGDRRRSVLNKGDYQMTTNSHGYVFPRDGKPKPAKRANHLGRVLLGVVTIYNKAQEKGYRYLEVRVGLDLLEKMGFVEGDRLQFGIHPDKLQAAVQPCKAPAGYPVRIHGKRNVSGMIHVPEAELPFPLVLVPDFAPIDVGFLSGRLAFNDKPGLTLEAHPAFALGRDSRSIQGRRRGDPQDPSEVSPAQPGSIFVDGRRFL